MSPQQVELILSLVESAVPLIVTTAAAGAQWLQNRDEVQAMIDEGRDPTPEEHRRLTRELDGLNADLDAAVERATGTTSDEG